MSTGIGEPNLEHFRAYYKTERENAIVLANIQSSQHQFIEEIMIF